MIVPLFSMQSASFGRTSHHDPSIIVGESSLRNQGSYVSSSTEQYTCMITEHLYRYNPYDDMKWNIYFTRSGVLVTVSSYESCAHLPNGIDGLYRGTSNGIPSEARRKCSKVPLQLPKMPYKYRYPFSPWGDDKSALIASTVLSDGDRL